MQKVIFRDKVCYVCEGRVKPKEHKDDYFYYDMRHADDDWSQPITIENKVLCNYFGALATKEKLHLEHEWDKGRFETDLTEQESELLGKAASDNMTKHDIDEDQKALTIDNLYDDDDEDDNDHEFIAKYDDDTE